MGDPIRLIEYRLLKAKQENVKRSKNYWGERYPHEKPHISARREKGAQAREKWERRARGMLELPPLKGKVQDGPSTQWRPINGMVVLTEKMPPVLPVMEVPERRNGRRVEKARWFAHLDG